VIFFESQARWKFLGDMGLRKQKPLKSEKTRKRVLFFPSQTLVFLPIQGRAAAPPCL
jgi:hypothetical protein